MPTFLTHDDGETATVEGLFGAPVELDDYADAVAVPMDLGTVRQRLDAGELTRATFSEQVTLTFRNCIGYNLPNFAIVKLAKKLLKHFILLLIVLVVYRRRRLPKARGARVGGRGAPQGD